MNKLEINSKVVTVIITYNKYRIKLLLEKRFSKGLVINIIKPITNKRESFM